MYAIILPCKNRFGRKIKIEKILVNDITLIKVKIKKKANIKKLEKKLIKYAKYAIISSELSNIKIQKIKLFNTNKFLNKIAINTALNICKNLENPSQICALLIDPKAKKLKFAKELSKIVGTLKIQTNSAKYLDFADDFFLESGNLPIIEQKFNNFDLAFDFSCSEIKFYFKDFFSPYYLTKECVSTPISPAKYGCQGIGAVEMTSLLCEFKEFGHLKNLIAKYLRRRDQLIEITPQNISKMLDKN